MKRFIHTAATMSALFVLTLVCGPLASFLAWRDPKRPDSVIRFWARWILKAANVRPILRLPEQLPPHFVLVTNHQSHFDVLMLFAHVPAHMRFVAKAELFKIPVFGPSIRRLGNLKVERGGSERDRKTLSAAAQSVARDVNIVFFPEGTRSPDGEIKAFKKGAASLAIEAQVPILPVAIAGTGEILPKGSLFVDPGRRAALVVGEPISTLGKSQKDREAVTQLSREAVERLLSDARSLVSDAHAAERAESSVASKA